MAPACRASPTGRLLFLMHLVSEMRDPEKAGDRDRIVHDGSPLFRAGSGESSVQRWVLYDAYAEPSSPQ